MKKSDTTYIIGSIFSATTALFYCCTMWLSIRLPRYYPLQHSWKWVNEKGVPSQGWYGMQAFAFLAAGAVSFVVYFILLHLFAISEAAEKTLKPAQTKILGVVVTLIIVICMVYMLYHEFDKWGIF
ncbi:MAG: hypothetical protein ACE5NM_12320 [Sedimentisphaerales bacterium]